MQLTNRKKLGLLLIMAVLIGLTIGLLVTDRPHRSCSVTNVEHVSNPTHDEATYETRLMDEQIQCASGY